jgi:competence protein ComGC
MKTKRNTLAFSLFEVLIIVAVVMVLVALLLPALNRPRTHHHVSCVNNLKQVGLAFRIWAGDHNDLYPMQVSVTNGGTMEFVGTLETFRHFEVMSNELNTPKILFCLYDTSRSRADYFKGVAAGPPGSIPFVANSNLSYFAGVDAADLHPESFLSGDRNITGGTSVKSGMLELTNSGTVKWTHDIHVDQGHVGLADGSVQVFGITQLRDALNRTGLATNRLAMP